MQKFYCNKVLFFPSPIYLGPKLAPQQQIQLNLTNYNNLCQKYSQQKLLYDDIKAINKATYVKRSHARKIKILHFLFFSSHSRAHYFCCCCCCHQSLANRHPQPPIVSQPLPQLLQPPSPSFTFKPTSEVNPNTNTCLILAFMLDLIIDHVILIEISVI